MDAAVDYAWMESPVGRLLVAARVDAIRQILFAAGRVEVRPEPDWHEGSALVNEAVRQLAAYFAGGLRRFDLPLTTGGTAFQRRVWQELVTIPYGETMSYGELARRIGQPSASRAVGLANGANPISIVIPCHRVVGSDGRLTGYGGGLKAKAWLLALERGGLLELPAAT
jgi:methylated-DNA-[protein]-cysteine S-methyltransferase